MSSVQNVVLHAGALDAVILASFAGRLARSSLRLTCAHYILPLFKNIRYGDPGQNLLVASS